MKNLEELELNEIENLTIRDLMTYSSSSSGNSGSSGTSGSSGGSDESGSGPFYTPCPEDECSSANPCPSSGVCIKGGDCGFLNLSSWNKCRPQTQQEEACNGKRLGDYCHILQSNGNYNPGKCSNYGYGLVCVDTWIPVKP
jgi:hypothetical protein